MTLARKVARSEDRPGVHSAGGEIVENCLADYSDFLRRKVRIASDSGFEVNPDEINPALKPFVRDIVRWAAEGGRRGIFSAFGLHKTSTQLELMRLVKNALSIDRPYRLIVLPLGVRQEFFRDALSYFRDGYSVALKFVQSTAELDGPDTIYLTNWETVREGKLDLSIIGAVSLDEASCLRSFGSKTFGEMLFGPMQDVPLRWVATATPSPNDYIELLAYAQFLGVMDIGEAKTRFFKRNAEKADDLTLHPHKEREFWLWVSSWALFVQKPSDLGYSDDGYELPDLEIHWHEVPTDHQDAGENKYGQGLLLKDSRRGVSEAAREKRDSLPARLTKLLELRSIDEAAHRILWHDLESERDAIERNVPGVVSVYGSQDLVVREKSVIGFSDGTIRELAGKPSMLGSGCNFQRHCAWGIYLGIGYKFNDFIQSIYRLQRFQQTKRVRIDLIYTEAERGVREELERKWAQDKEQRLAMGAIIREYGLSQAALASTLTRHMGCERVVAEGSGWKAVKDDSVVYAQDIPDDSQGMILTSIPFSTQYEYTPSYNDFGHTDDEAHFFEQMDFLTPNLFRSLKPGRVCAVHVKDRVMPGIMTGTSYQSIAPFHAHCILHFVKHGFTYGGMITISTDVVRENNQTYRLGYSELCKDASKMGVGLPEYVLLFRRPPTDPTKGYADERVTLSNQQYSLARWQIDAHSVWKSGGDRLLIPEDFEGLSVKQTYRLFRSWSFACEYDHEKHVAIGEGMAARGKLRKDFSMIPVASSHPEIWTDIMRARTLNSEQSRRRREKHLCPLQIDVVDRLIRRFTNPGDVVFDPFGGVGTVPVRSVILGRQGHSCELNSGYWGDSCSYLRAAETDASIPSLFDLLLVEEETDLPEEAIA